MKSSWRRTLGYLWAGPNTALGLCVVPLTLLTGGRVQQRRGALEVYGGAATFLLRYGTLLKAGASAMTIGHVILGRDVECLDRCRDHEHVHVRQYERWGPFFLPAYLAASVIAGLRGGDMYRDNAFEVEAYSACPPA